MQSTWELRQGLAPTSPAGCGAAAGAGKLIGLDDGAHGLGARTMPPTQSSGCASAWAGRRNAFSVGKRGFATAWWSALLCATRAFLRKEPPEPIAGVTRLSQCQGGDAEWPALTDGLGRIKLTEHLGVMIEFDLNAVPTEASSYTRSSMSCWSGGAGASEARGRARGRAAAISLLPARNRPARHLDRTRGAGQRAARELPPRWCWGRPRRSINDDCARDPGVVEMRGGARFEVMRDPTTRRSPRSVFFFELWTEEGR